MPPHCQLSVDVLVEQVQAAARAGLGGVILFGIPEHKDAEGTDSCDANANDANCDNGLWCDGAETCHVTSGCQVGTAPDCNDGVGCTSDSCNDGTDS